MKTTLTLQIQVKPKIIPTIQTYHQHYLISTALLFGLIVITSTLKAQVPGFKVNNSLSGITSPIKMPRLDTSSKKDSTYVTTEIIIHNYLELDLKEKQKKLKVLDSLYKNSKGESGPRWPAAKISAAYVMIGQLVKEIKEINHKMDSLYYIYTKDYVNYNQALLLSFGPLRSRAFFDIMYDNEGKIVSVLNNTGFNFGSQTGALYSELVSGQLFIFRTSLGAMVVSSSEENPEEEKHEEAYQRLATYGGNTVLNMEYPLAYFHTRNKQFNFLSRFMARGSADFPAFGTTTDKVAGSAMYGIDFYGDASTSNNAMRFFFNFNLYRIKGTDAFKENLGVSSSAFNYGQLIVGLVISEKIKISFIVNTISSEKMLRDATLIGGGQVLHH